MERKLLKTYFHRELNSGVGVLRNDGLLHYGTCTMIRLTGMKIDFGTKEGVVHVPYKRIFGATHRSDRDFKRLREDDLASVLVKLHPEESWKWCPAKLVISDSQEETFGLVKIKVKGTVSTAVVPGRQICPLLNVTKLQPWPGSYRTAKNLMMHRIAEEKTVPSPVCSIETPVVPINRFLPPEILSLIFRNLDTTEQTGVRRVCTKWNDIIVGTTNRGTLRISKHGKKSYDDYRMALSLHNLWSNTTKCIVLENLVYNATKEYIGLSCIKELMEFIMLEHGYSPLKTLVLCITEEYTRPHWDFDEFLNHIVVVIYWVLHHFYKICEEVLLNFDTHIFHAIPSHTTYNYGLVIRVCGGRQISVLKRQCGKQADTMVTNNVWSTHTEWWVVTLRKVLRIYEESDSGTLRHSTR